jgi:hypothetical protein
MQAKTPIFVQPKMNPMNKFYTLLFTLFVGLASLAPAHAQVVDALALRKMVGPDGKFITAQKESIIELLATNAGMPGASAEAVITAYESAKNSIITSMMSPEFKTTEPLPDFPNAEESIRGEVAEEFGFSLSGLNVSKVADGLAQFLVERTKAELNASFFNRLKTFLDNRQEVKILFPGTREVLMNVDRDVYRYSLFIESIRQAADHDFQLILPNLASLLDQSNSNYKPEVVAIGAAGLRLTQSLIDGAHPSTIIQQLANEPFDINAPSLALLSSSFKGASLISNSLIDGQGWVKKPKISALAADSSAMKLYIGLLYQKSGDLSFGPNANMRSLLTKFYLGRNAWSTLANYLLNLHGNANAYENAQMRMAQAGPKSSYDQVLMIAESTLRYTLQALLFKEQVLGLPLSEWERKTFDLSRIGLNMAVDLRYNRYSSVIVGLTSFMKELFVEEDNRFVEQFLRYGTFLAGLIEAQSAEEVKYLIESVALPVGGAAIKKNSRFNVSINSYVGINYSREQYSNPALSSQAPGNVLAIHAPVGIAASWGLGRSGMSASLFIPIVDIGALTAFRFGDETSELLPEIKLGNIIAPGAYLAIGMPKIPVSIGFGGQFGPNLRKVTVDGLTYSQSGAYRLGAFLSVDIPIFNIFNATR